MSCNNIPQYHILLTKLFLHRNWMMSPRRQPLSPLHQGSSEFLTPTLACKSPPSPLKSWLIFCSSTFLRVWNICWWVLSDKVDFVHLRIIPGIWKQPSYFSLKGTCLKFIKLIQSATCCPCYITSQINLFGKVQPSIEYQQKLWKSNHSKHKYVISCSMKVVFNKCHVGLHAHDCVFKQTKALKLQWVEIFWQMSLSNIVECSKCSEHSVQMLLEALSTWKGWWVRASCDGLYSDVINRMCSENYILLRYCVFVCDHDLIEMLLFLNVDRNSLKWKHLKALKMMMGHQTSR